MNSASHQASTSRAGHKAAVKQYPCEECGKVIKQKCHMKNHLLIHTGEKPHRCTICNKYFRRKSHLTIHMRLHTGEKPYTCETCGKEFSHSHNYRRHKNWCDQRNGVTNVTIDQKENFKENKSEMKDVSIQDFPRSIYTDVHEIPDEFHFSQVIVMELQNMPRYNALRSEQRIKQIIREELSGGGQPVVGFQAYSGSASSEAYGPLQEFEVLSRLIGTTLQHMPRSDADRTRGRINEIIIDEWYYATQSIQPDLTQTMP